MGTIAKDTGGGRTYQPAPSGSHRAACIGVIDLGLQIKTFNGETNVKHEILLMFELVDESMDDGRPFTVSRAFTNSLHEKAGLRKFLDNWRGTPFTETELKGWDLKNLLGKPCLLSIVHAEKGDRTYANIGAASKLPKGMAAPDSTVNDLRYFDIDSHEVPEWMPLWIARKVRDSQEYKQNDFDDRGPVEDANGRPVAAHQASTPMVASSAASTDDDIPF